MILHHTLKYQEKTSDKKKKLVILAFCETSLKYKVANNYSIVSILQYVYDLLIMALGLPLPKNNTYSNLTQN